MDVRTDMLVFFQDSEGLTKFQTLDVHPNDPGRLRDIGPENFLFGLPFVPELTCGLTISPTKAQGISDSHNPPET